MTKRSLLIQFFFLLGSFTTFASYLERENAVAVIVPVTDSVGEPLQKSNPDCAVDVLYDKIPFSPESLNSCPRIRQFIYNEVGICVKCTPDGTEACVEFPHIFYQTEKDKKKVHTFWVPVKNIMPVKKLRDLEALDCIPEPINCTEPFSASRFENILTLIFPWQDPLSKVVYSAGTRFKRAKHIDTHQGYGIHLLDEKCKTKQALVEKNKALVDYPNDYQGAKKLFVKILKMWVEMGLIPYTWGGSSFCFTYTDELERVIEERGDKKVEYWMRPFKSTPHDGFDCSGLVLRAAQMAGLAYFFSNTTTLALYLTDIETGQEVEEGDLIWFKGHVMIVANVKENTLIQAISYSSGYACVHEIPLVKVFENCSCYAELQQYCQNKTALKIKNKAGHVVKTIESFRLLRNAYAIA